MYQTVCHKNDIPMESNINQEINMYINSPFPTIAVLGDMDEDRIFYVCRHNNFPDVCVLDPSGVYRRMIEEYDVIYALGMENDPNVAKPYKVHEFIKGSYPSYSFSMFGYSFAFSKLLKDDDEDTRVVATMIKPNGDVWSAVYEQ